MEWIIYGPNRKIIQINFKEFCIRCFFKDHDGINDFQAKLRHLSSSPLIEPSPLASHPGSLRFKAANKTLALVALIEVTVLFLSSLLLRSALKAESKVGSGNVVLNLC